MSLDPNVAMKVYDHPKGSFVGWLRDVAARGGSAPASDLVEIVGTERARPLLRAALELGLIEREVWEPSVEQRFFGIGGMRSIRRVSPSFRDFHVEAWRVALTSAGWIWVGELQEGAR